MIKDFINKVIRKLRETDAEEPRDTLKRLSKKVAPSNKDAMGETLNWLNKIKNSITVRTGKHEALTSLFTGQKMYVDTRDVSVAPHLMFDGMWEPEITKVFQQVVKPGDTVLDLGANFGYFALVAGSVLQQEPDDSRILIVEANPVFIPYINKSLSVNGLSLMSDVLNVGVASDKSVINLNLLKDDWGSSTAQSEKDFKKRRRTEYEIERVIDVEADTVDNLCKSVGIDKVDVIKMDIEGLEESSYPGMKKIIKNSSNLKLLLEFTLQGYREPKKFYTQLSKDFKFVYAINAKNVDAQLIEVTGYNHLVELADNDWIMLLLAKEQVSGVS